MIKIVVNMRDSETLPRKVELTFFNKIELSLKYNSIASTFKFEMYFDPNNPIHAELATVSHIHECSIYWVHETEGRYINEQGRFVTTKNQLLLTGFMLSQLFHSSSKPTLMEIGGYSKPGVLADCDIPTDVPLEAVGLSFTDVVKKVLRPWQERTGAFGFKIKSTRSDLKFEATQDKELNSLKSILASIEDESDATIEKTTVSDESKNALNYLQELASQKGLTLSHDVMGDLVVGVPYTGRNYLFEIGTNNGIAFEDMYMGYNGQPLHSQIEVKRPPDKNGGDLAYCKMLNPLVPVVFRPKVIIATTGDANTIIQTARNEIGAELKSIPLRIVLKSPIVKENFIMPNNMINVKNRQVYLYKPHGWFIEEVNYSRDADNERTEITSVLPETYLSNYTPVTGQKDTYRATIQNPFIDPHENVPRL
jgi:prophage tail gpP-like protein